MRITTADIIAATAARYRIGVDDLKSPSRRRRFAWPRHVAMAAAWRLTDDSLTKIGRAFNRDHTTVYHALAALETHHPPAPFALYEIAIAAWNIAAERQVRTWFLARRLIRTGSAVLEAAE